MKYTGYEDHENKLKAHNKHSFSLLSELERAKVIESVFKVYRSVGIYPIQQFDDEGIKNEILACLNKDIPLGMDISKIRYNQGGAVCRFLFPNLRDVEQGGDKRTLNRKFNDDHMLKRAIEFCLKYKNSKCPVMPSGLKDGLEMMGGGVATNFKPMSAKAIYERYCPEGGNILDYAAGFGGRMLGALTSKNNYKYTGIEPSTKTYRNLCNLSDHIKEAIYDRAFTDGDIRILNGPSEDVIKNIPDQFDFAFSSPPYFNLENYSDEATQSHIKNPTIDLWFNDYVAPTISAIHERLKDGCLLAVNIADYNYKGKSVKIVDRWIDETIKAGFKFIGTDEYLSVQTRRGIGHGDNNINTKKEGIYLFKKV